MDGINISTRSVAGLSALLLAACAGTPLRATEPDGTYCYRVGKINRAWRTCTTTPKPGDAAEADAKRFEARPDVATLYVVRNRWADTINRVGVSIDGQRRVDTIPGSVVRVRLRPGQHALLLDWKDLVEARTLDLKPGEVRFLEIEGSAHIGATGYKWFGGDINADISGARARATRSKLIADIDLSAP